MSNESFFKIFIAIGFFVIIAESFFLKNSANSPFKTKFSIESIILTLFVILEYSFSSLKKILSP